ncbi:dienelactone hydrolase family protein [uncultured Zhongshania sp.]|uniref:dienelactone hydrolase family protein n=1 Tax=uncultured Zhongshania sp. TaxID=1642288 RepID=UPI0030D8095F
MPNRAIDTPQWKAGTNKQAPIVEMYPDFEPGSFSFKGVTRPVYKSGEGPAIIVIHEIPGIYDEVWNFARRLNKEGFTTYLPSLIGSPGMSYSTKNLLKSMSKLCVSKEFNRFAFREEAPIADWLRALARDAHRSCGGPGVGAIGMCFSGGFALAMMADESVIAPVLSQPSMPFMLSKKLRHDIDVNPSDIPKIKARMERDDICLIGLRFSGDKMVPENRFRYLTENFGDKFIGISIDSSKGNSHNIKASAHSVLTRDYVDEEDHPTYQAFQQVLALFKKQLLLVHVSSN